MTSVRISHSTIRDLNSCPRKVLFKQILRLFPKAGSTAMRYGSGFHIAMEAYYKNNKDLMKAIEAAALWWQKPTIQEFESDYRNLESLVASISLYHEQFGRDSEKIAGIPENKITTKIHLTSDEKSCYGDFEVEFVVVIDLILGVDNMNWVVDFKTTSVDLPFMASRLRKMPQLMGYQFVGQEKFGSIAGTMVYYHQLKATKSRKTGEYGDIKTDFMKFPQIYSSTEYPVWRRYIVWNAFALMKAADAGYPANYNSCYEFNKACEYLPLCDYPKWDISRFLEMDGFVHIPDEREVIDEAK